MAITATFYQHAKKQNSTKLPTASTTKKVYNISLKDVTDLYNPVILVHADSAPISYNFCYIPSFNRYYWVLDWTWENGIWSASLKTDVLSSFRSAIGGSTQYVKRGSKICDPDIIDIYPRKAGSTITTTTATTGLASDLSSMTYIIGVTSASPTEATIGTTVFYAVSYADCKAFIAHLVSMSYATFTDISDGLAKWLCNPFQWIRSIVVLPVPYTSVNSYGWTSASAIKFGANGNGAAFSYTCSCYIVTSSQSVNVSFSIPIPKHPDADANHSYLKAEPFSNYSVIIPPFGKMQLSSASLYSISDLYCLIRIDPGTGGCTLYLGPDNTHYGAILTVESQVGVSLPVDAAVVDLGEAGLSSMMATLAAGGVAGAANISGGLAISPLMSFASGANMQTGSLADVFTSFFDGAAGALSRVSTISSGGKLCDLGFYPLLFLEYFKVVEEDNTNFGRPIAQRKKLSTCGGFVLCSNAEIAIATATYNEMREIESYMNSGFFYE